MDTLVIDWLGTGALIAGLGVAALWDLRTMRIPRAVPNGLVIVWVGCAIGALVATGPRDCARWMGGVVGRIAGAALIVGALLVVRSLLAHRSSATPLGVGDVKLLAVVGLYLGVERTLGAVLCACAIALALAWTLPRLGWVAPSARQSPALATCRRTTLPVVPFAPAIALAVIFVELF